MPTDIQVALSADRANAPSQNSGTEKAQGRSWFRWTVSTLSGIGSGLVNLVLWPCCSLKNACVRSYKNLSADSSDTTQKTNQIAQSSFSRVSQEEPSTVESSQTTAITQKEINSHRETKEVKYGNLKDGPHVSLINDSNKQGAIRALSSYLKCFGLEISQINKKDPTLVKSESTANFQLEDGELKIINGQLLKVLNGSVNEDKLTSEIHKAFKSLIESRENSKEISSKIAEIRGQEIPSTMENRIVIKAEGDSPEIVITEELNAFDPSTGTRISSNRDNDSLKNKATNLFTHEIEISVNGKSIKKTFIRGGAPCCHTKETTEKLIKKAENILGLKDQDHLSTYTRVKKILEANNIELIEVKNSLQEHLDISTNQMMERLQSAYKINPQKGSTTFKHGEMSLLSPGNKKERSMALDSEMAMENLTQNYVIDENGSVIKKDDKKDSQTTKEIRIVLTQVAVNEHQFTTSRVQESINLRAVNQLRKIIEDTNNTFSSNDKNNATKLLNDIEKRTKDPNRLFSDETIVQNFNKVFELLGMTQGVFCKSGKDRTAQGVINGIIENITDDLINSYKPTFSENPTVQVMTEKVYGLYSLAYPLLGRVRGKVKRALQEYGLGLLLAGANTLRENLFAFNPLQMAIMPRFAQAPWRICGSVGT
jgi:hypothetical protein